MMETLYGTLFIGIPALLVGLLLFWSNYRPVFWMLLGALVVGLGYLGTTGATYDIGKPIAEAISGQISRPTSDAAPTNTAAPTPAPTKTVAPAPTPSNASAAGSGSTTISSPPGRYVTP